MWLALAGLALLSLAFGVFCLVTTEGPTEEQMLPRLVCRPLAPAAVDPPPEPDPPRKVPEAVRIRPRAPISLSKFRSRAPLRAPVPRAELPRSSDRPCDRCNGVALVWTPSPLGGWCGLCRRCGGIFADAISGAGWQAPRRAA